jgi:prepilin-type N-terminal cleavage/methylation domain-containing protein
MLHRTTSVVFPNDGYQTDGFMGILSLPHSMGVDPVKHEQKLRGFTLMELLIVMSIASVLLLVTIGWIHQSMKYASVIKQRQRNHINLTRLAWALRDDVRECQFMSMADENRLVLTSGETQISYTISDSSLMVEKKFGKEAQPMIREAYELPASSTIDWDTSEMPDWITLVVYRGGPGGPDLDNSLSLEPSTSSSQASTMPVDLHVRVAANRWGNQLSPVNSSIPARDQK